MSHLDEGMMNALLDGELDADEQREIERHLATCAECARRMLEVREFFGEADAIIGKLEVPGSTRPVVLPGSASKHLVGPTLLPNGLPSAPEAAPVSTRLSRYRQLAWAASVVLAVGLGYFASGQHRNETESDAIRVASKSADTAHQPSAPSESPSAGAGGATDERARTDAPAASAVQTSPQSSPGASRKTPEPGSDRESSRGAVNNSPPAAQGFSAASVESGVTTRKQAERLEGTSGNVGQTADAATHAPAPTQQVPAPSGTPSQPPMSAGRTNLADLVTNGTARASGQPAERRSAPAAKPLAAETTRVQPLPVDRFAAVGTPPSEVGIVPPNTRPSSPGFFHITMDDAVRRLAGTIHLIDGMTPDRVEAASGRVVAGAEPGPEVVRIIYLDPPGREIWLDQQRFRAWATLEKTDTNDASRLGSPSLLPGDTVVSTANGGTTTVRWLDGRGFWLSLTGNIGADSVLALVKRVR
ncbi:MAG: zf-HC2 domain-containing protein [Gemmatimonadota bacterium]